MNSRARLKKYSGIFLIGFLTACSGAPQTSVSLYKVDLETTSPTTGLDQYFDRTGKAVLLETPAIIDENCIARTALQFDPNTHEPVVMLKLKSKCKNTLAIFTRKNVGNQMALVIDGKLITVAIIQEEIAKGTLIMSSGF